MRSSQKTISTVARILASFLCLILLTGFKFPSPHQLRKEFQAELNKIKESTPGAKAFARWKTLRDQAKEALKNADIQGASKFAAEEFEEASYLFKRAKQYALKKSYKKASYLARKTIEVATMAAEKAAKAREAVEKKLNRHLTSVKAKLDQIHAKLPYDSEYDDSLAELYLKWSDIRHAISLGQYEQANNELQDLVKNLKAFIKATGIEIDSEKERWEETI